MAAARTSHTAGNPIPPAFEPGGRSCVELVARVPSASILRMAKPGVVIDDWMQANDLDAGAMQRWTCLQQSFSANACTLMSIMSDKMVSSACQVDVTGVVSMYAPHLPQRLRA